MVTTTMLTAAATAAATAGGEPVDWWVVLVSSAVVAAAVSAAVTVFLAFRSSRLAERARVREAFADAYQAYTEYKEFPYAIRRRRADEPAAERIRLSEELRHVQARVSHYQAWTRTECVGVGEHYLALVSTARRVAGAEMARAWQAQPLDNDTGMNIRLDQVDLRELDRCQDAYVAVAARHLNYLASGWGPFRTECGRPPATDRSKPPVPDPAPDTGNTGNAPGNTETTENTETTGNTGNTGTTGNTGNDTV